MHYSDLKFLQVKDKENLKEKEEVAHGTANFLKCWSFEVIKQNLIVKKRIPPQRAHEVVEKFFEEELFEFYMNNLDNIP